VSNSIPLSKEVEAIRRKVVEDFAAHAARLAAHALDVVPARRRLSRRERLLKAVQRQRRRARSLIRR
jgi:hypothetical protein